MQAEGYGAIWDTAGSNWSRASRPPSPMGRRGFLKHSLHVIGQGEEAGLPKG